VVASIIDPGRDPAAAKSIKAEILGHCLTHIRSSKATGALRPSAIDKTMTSLFQPIQTPSTPNRNVRDYPLNGHTVDIAKPA
jgi:hypothetical protein